MLVPKTVVADDDPEVLIAPPYPPLVAAGAELVHRDAQRHTGLTLPAHRTVDVLSASPEPVLREHAEEPRALGHRGADKGGAGDPFG